MFDHKRTKLITDLTFTGLGLSLVRALTMMRLYGFQKLHPLKTRNL